MVADEEEDALRLQIELTTTTRGQGTFTESVMEWARELELEQSAVAN